MFRANTHHLLVLLCPSLGDLTVRSWVTLPLLFLGSSAGITAVLGLLVESQPTLTQSVALSAPLLFGVAATLALISGHHVRWAARWQRRWLRFPYPGVMLVIALGNDYLRVPALVALVAGAVATTLLVVFVVRTAREPTECSSPV
ncbi:hypothetical protein GCM10027563_04460 [Parasphingorhabdus pacifica]